MEQPLYLKCRCGFFRRTSGLSSELKDLHEYKKCANCGGPRSFRCPKCGTQLKLIREKRNVR